MTCPAGGAREDGRCETRLQDYFDAQRRSINERRTRRPIRACSCRCAISRRRWCSASRRPRRASPGTTCPPARPARPTAIHQIGPFPMRSGQVITSTDVRNVPDYAGGLIGFALIKTRPTRADRAVYYSEYRSQRPCTGGTMPGHWKMALAYRSTSSPNVAITWRSRTGRARTRDLVRQRRRLQRQGVPDRRRDLRGRRRAVQRPSRACARWA